MVVFQFMLVALVFLLVFLIFILEALEEIKHQFFPEPITEGMNQPPIQHEAKIVDVIPICYFQYFAYCYFQRITDNLEHIVPFAFYRL